MLDNFLRIGVIFFSTLALPFLVRLIYGLLKDDILGKKTNKTAILLISLFFMLLFIAVLSIAISLLALLQINGFSHTAINLGFFSKLRSLFVSMSNAGISYYFYKIYLDGRK